MKRLPAFNWLNVKTANKKQVDGLYENDYQVILIDPRLGDRRLVKTIIHEILHYLSDSYPSVIQKLNEKDVQYYTNIFFNLIKKGRTNNKNSTLKK
jgi:Zn-dependent peptidase ImmA (M78 family)